MCKSINFRLPLAVILSIITTFCYAGAGNYNIGTTATIDQVSGWDIDVRPDGKGLPEGSGSVVEGEMLYEDKCASCHGSFGEGMDRWPILAGGLDTLTEDRPEKNSWQLLAVCFHVMGLYSPCDAFFTAAVSRG